MTILRLMLWVAVGLTIWALAGAIVWFAGMWAIAESNEMRAL